MQTSAPKTLPSHVGNRESPLIFANLVSSPFTQPRRQKRIHLSRTIKTGHKMNGTGWGSRLTASIENRQALSTLKLVLPISEPIKPAQSHNPHPKVNDFSPEEDFSPYATFPRTSQRQQTFKRAGVVVVQPEGQRVAGSPLRALRECHRENEDNELSRAHRERVGWGEWGRELIAAFLKLSALYVLRPKKRWPFGRSR
ncbi:hypothetical protein EJ08DRAFT_155161 [Tothia fuscella]|uniref:Uncharacterized protein n=1 Tax=Tothia fuscella TaxID=1048955 RepID=A0A9P4P1Q4_9PEZI|nr:hypothetical protein EJ08DRAFT_155161 [Tothia fuscella]